MLLGAVLILKMIDQQRVRENVPEYWNIEIT